MSENSTAPVNMNSALGEFTLKRYPEPPQHGQAVSLQAWDGSDLYTLETLHQWRAESALADGAKVFILNDSFGALSCALAAQDWCAQVANSSDSFLGQEACRRNAALLSQAHNAALNEKISYLSPFEPAGFQPDLVLIKIPKTLALLEDQLHRLRPQLSPQSQVLGLGMVKGIHTNTLKLFDKLLGETRTSLAKKKARLILPTLNRLNETLPTSPYPSRYTLENTDYPIVNHANVFSRASLDIGTRLFLQHLPRDCEGDIADLGCGNGVVGLIAAERNPKAKIHFFDESHMAIASAQDNFSASFAQRSGQYHTGNSLEGQASDSLEVVLNNPPFHQQNAIGDYLAWQMFTDAKRCLKHGGQLWVVGNRHLGYHVKLKKLFGNCQQVAQDRKFVVLKAVVTD